jgi:hypothetical protein
MSLSPLRVLFSVVATIMVSACASSHVDGANSVSNAMTSAGRDFVVSFSDEFDAARFDLEGRSFPLRLIGSTAQKGGRGGTYDLYEFEFKGAPIKYRDGSLAPGNMFMVLSRPLEGSHGPWGARVIMFDPAGTTVPIGRASLSD